MRVLLCLFPLLACGASLRVDTADFELPGGWAVGREFGGGVRAFLTSGAATGTSPAATAVRIPAAGKWRLWVRSKDFPNDRPGVRNFSLRLGAQRAGKQFGRHASPGIDGWEWEDGGVFDLRAGPLLIVLGETATPFARTDALLLTEALDYRPAGLPWSLKAPAAERVPLSITAADPARRLVPPPLENVEPRAAAALANGSARIEFHRATSGGAPAVAMRWQNLPADPSAESYRVLYRPLDKDPRLAAGVHPSWDMTFAPNVRAGAGGASVVTRNGSVTAPWNSALSYALRPSGCVQRDARTVELSFPPTPAGRLTAVWRIEDETPAARLTLRFAPARPGHVSLGYHGLVAAPPQALDFLLLPFMFHGRRFPERPVTLLSSFTPAPLALVTRGKVSYALLAEPEDLSSDWPSELNSRYAFGIRNETGEAQPFVYSPVLGQPGSTTDGAAAVETRLWVWCQAGDWYSAYKRIVTERFGLRDYRRPVFGSLSDAALNLYDLIKSGAGWDGRAKGPWNIEARNVVTHSSPLLYMSLYLLTGEEAMYRRFALPALEYLVSRASPHFAAVEPYGPSYYTGAPLGGPAASYGATVWASAFAMTAGRTAAFGGFSLDGSAPRATRGNNHVQPFEDALALYRLTGETAWLRQAVEGAGRYIAQNLTQLPSRDLGTMPFIDVSFIPDWEGLLHLYEATGEKRFLAAAAEGARWLVTTLWVHPGVEPGERTIHPGGLYDGERHLWYLGDKRFRLGVREENVVGSDAPPRLPATPLPERKVPAWQVSVVGLGLEQPVTWARREGGRNITMAAWAPNLLRLAALTGDDLFRTAARNAIIGRFTNYPGYYISGYTDVYQKPDYPLNGPDVTSIYYHHIPTFTAFVLDYLFTDAEVRSHGAVAFPFVRQNGYVWFDSRLYGHAPGKVYGETAWPWLHRTAVTLDNVAVDRVLAHGGGKFHAILLNQTREPQTVRVRFDAAALGRALDDATAVEVRLENSRPVSRKLAAGAVSVTLAPLGIAALSLGGVRIDVPTHRVSAGKLPLPAAPAIERRRIPGTNLEAVGTLIAAPPFASRELYVYVAAGMHECAQARLFYRVGEGPERQAAVDRFPCEFSIRLEDTQAPVSWRVESPGAPR